MKFILVIITLFAHISFADVKVEIKNAANVVTHGGEFRTQAEAETWVDELKPTGAWGKLERWLTAEAAQKEGLSTAGKETRQVGEDQVTEYKFPQEFSVHYSDITSEVQKRDAISQALKDIENGKNIVAFIVARNREKQLTTAQVSQIAQTFAPILSLLQSGSLTTARAAASAITPDGTLITAQDKADFLAEIDKYL